jgi:excinuclease ABC subunit B
MYHGDQSRKQTLVEYGFRLPSAMDNRPLKFEEFMRRMGKTVYTSATPAPWELSLSQNHIVEQLIRPTGLVDPEVIIRPTAGQVADLISEIKKRVDKGQRVLVTTLTKRMAEDLANYLEEKGIKVHYLHSEIVTLERLDILSDLRTGKYDVVVGINLLREGLDLPEVSLVAILDADKEGFLRSQTSLVQTMGRAARHVDAQVIMYADEVTNSMSNAIREVERRRLVQLEYNQIHHITPQSITKPLRERLVEISQEPVIKLDPRQILAGRTQDAVDIDMSRVSQMIPEDIKRLTKLLTNQMRAAAQNLDFELAAKIRDKIQEIRQISP